MKTAALFIIVLAVSIALSPLLSTSIGTAYARAKRYYVGYLFKLSYRDTKGVLGIIKVVRPNISEPGVFMAQWVDIKISYYMNHRVQLGYVVYENDIRAFYREILDWRGRDLNYYTKAEKPQYGRYYKFIIALVKVSGQYYWFFSIIDDSGGNVVAEVVKASTTYHCNLQVLIEMNSDNVGLPGSHFKDLKYFNVRNEWHLWNYNFSIADYPYYIHPVHQYEFWAWRR